MTKNKKTRTKKFKSKKIVKIKKKGISKKNTIGGTLYNKSQEVMKGPGTLLKGVAKGFGAAASVGAAGVEGTIATSKGLLNAGKTTLSAVTTLGSIASSTSPGQAVGKLGIAAVGLGTASVEFGTAGIEGATTIVKGLQDTTAILSDSVKDTLVGSATTANLTIKGFFGSIKTVSKMFLLSDRITNSILNKALSIFKENDAMLESINERCDIVLKTGQEIRTSTNECVKDYKKYLSDIQKNLLPRILDIKTRMNIKIKNIMFFIKIEMIKCGCSKNIFQNKYSCKKNKEEIVYNDQLNKKLVYISSEYTELVKKTSRFNSEFIVEYNEYKKNYDSAYSAISNYTGKDANKDIVKTIREFNSTNSDIFIEKKLTDIFIDPLQTFLKILQTIVKNNEDAAYNDYIKKLNSEEKKKIEEEKLLKIKEATQMVSAVVEEVNTIPDNEMNEELQKEKQGNQDISVIEKQFNKSLNARTNLAQTSNNSQPTETSVNSTDESVTNPLLSDPPTEPAQPNP